MTEIFTPEILSLIIALIIGIPTLGIYYIKAKNKFSEFRELVVTLDEAWRDDRITEEEWDAIYSRMVRLVTTGTTKPPGK